MCLALLPHHVPRGNGIELSRGQLLSCLSNFFVGIHLQLDVLALCILVARKLKHCPCNSLAPWDLYSMTQGKNRAHCFSFFSKS
ncbi:hypothetical protein OIU85_015598 [Salix viminalis]|uniref:Uncharacterized protein n=1 Tax=Salix viminalis TaxID=40686 RepID=A0A9Q0V579_SALVM|nr:hypothetical protein OIU85_015598 [Salix viminalis]